MSPATLRPEFGAWLTDAHDPVDPVVRLAQQAGVVLLHGGGFDGPVWSVRVSPANLGGGARCVNEPRAASGAFRATTVRLTSTHQEWRTT